MKTVNGLAGSSAAYFISKHFEQAHIVLPSTRGVDDFLESLRYFYGEKAEVVLFPEYERFYEMLREEPHIGQQRISCIHRLQSKSKTPLILVSSGISLSQKIVDPQRLKKTSVYLMKSMELDRDQLVSQLKAIGYIQDEFAQDKGLFSVRGFLIDLFSPFDDEAYRIEFFGDEVASIRKFDPQTQRSLHEVQELELLPVREFFFSAAEKDSVRRKLKDLGDARGFPRGERDQLWDQIENNREIVGARWLTPATSKMKSLREIIPERFPLILVDPQLSKKELELSLKTDQENFESLSGLAFDLESLRETSVPELNDEKAQKIDRLISGNGISYQVGDFSQLRPRLLRARNFDPLIEEIDRLKKEDLRVRLVVRSSKRADTLRESLEGRIHEIEWDHGPIFSGFYSSTLSTAIITEKDIFGVRRRHQKSRSVEAGDFLREFSDLKDGDFIVHDEHGLGKFRGLKTLEIGSVRSEFAVLEYAEEDKLYLPLYRLDQLSRFLSGDGYAKPRLDRLGSQSFSKRKSKAKKDILRIAHELMEVAAQRKLRRIERQKIDEGLYYSFCSRFPYELTPDQEKSILKLEESLMKNEPIDLLVCGDVGFGKTEVAMRAAFFRSLQNVQVAVLAPTTLLTEQHYRGFKQRLEESGKKVARLSRFVSPKEQAETLSQLESGEIDVIIGTHRLLSKDIKFHRLGMLIIDEEQRFGVKHKEAIKRYRSEIDVVTLSATPIPRTLQMAIVGIRDLSLITTPPDTREAVTTHVGVFDENLIRQASERERERGGQILFVHNRVQSIQKLKDKLQKILPGFKIAVAHGQMHEDELEKIMFGFMNQKYDVLLATSIIENGLDIPNANTIFIDHSEQFGLSDLYQLRGRVGRSHRKAYSYFLIHEETPMTDEASKRLQVIQSCTELGSGFRVATHDLEIRGSGNLLGDAQSGVISEVGLELYNQMLEETLSELRNSEQKENLPEINSGYTAFIPEAYIPDPAVRISTYRQLNRMSSIEDILAYENEIRDRFGPYPEEVSNLLDLTQLRFYAHLFKAQSVEIFPGRLTMQLKDNTPISPAKLAPLLSKSLQLDPKGKLNYHFDSAFHKEHLLSESQFGRADEVDFSSIRKFYRKLAKVSDIGSL